MKSSGGSSWRPIRERQALRLHQVSGGASLPLFLIQSKDVEGSAVLPRSWWEDIGKYTAVQSLYFESHC